MERRGYGRKGNERRLKQRSRLRLTKTKVARSMLEQPVWTAAAVDNKLGMLNVTLMLQGTLVLQEQ